MRCRAHSKLVPEEPVAFEPKKVATRVKHLILERCLKAWGGIIANSNQGEIRLAFVDTCSGSGLYKSSDETEAAEGIYETGSALIGPQELAGVAAYARTLRRSVKTRVLLINADRAELETAKQVIHGAGLAAALDELRFEPRPLQDVQSVVSQFTHNWFSFVLIDPFGPSAAPFSVVADIVRGRYTDTLINFPFYSFQKWSGFLGREQTTDEKAKLAAVDAFMGSAEWRGIAQKARGAGQALGTVLIEHYLDQLGRLGVHALALPLLFEDRERVMYHLVFTSHNVAGLSSAKQCFLDGQTHEFKLRQELKMEAEVSRSGMGYLFAPLEPKKPEADLNALAEHLYGRFEGTTVAMKRLVLFALRVPLVLESDVRKALRILKKGGRAVFSELTYRDEVTFQAQRVPGDQARRP
jgi:three-Cys-motif partner protein